jgi:hypothetical protein
MLADLLVVGVKQTMTKKLYNDNKSYSWNEWLETCMVGIHVQNTTMVYNAMHFLSILQMQFQKTMRNDILGIFQIKIYILCISQDFFGVYIDNGMHILDIFHIQWFS